MAVDPRAPHRTALLRLAGNTPHGQPGGLSAQPNRSLRSSNTPAPAHNPPAKQRPAGLPHRGRSAAGVRGGLHSLRRSPSLCHQARAASPPAHARPSASHRPPRPAFTTASDCERCRNVAAWVEPCAEAEPCHWSAPASTYHQSSIVCELQRLAPRPRGLALCSKPASESSWAVHRERVHCGVKPI